MVIRGLDLISDVLPFTRPELTTGVLRRKENFARIRIFYCGSGRKTRDVDVTAI
jgi:hypothetical protein